MSEFARVCNLSRTTAYKYVALLEQKKAGERTPCFYNVYSFSAIRFNLTVQKSVKYINSIEANKLITIKNANNFAEIE